MQNNTQVLTEKGVRIVILLHLCPIIPFNVLNWVGGTSSMPAWTYAWTLIAILPGTLVYVCLGASASTLTLHQGNSSVWEIVSVVVGLILGTIGIFTMSYYAKQELRKVSLLLSFGLTLFLKYSFQPPFISLPRSLSTDNGATPGCSSFRKRIDLTAASTIY